MGQTFGPRHGSMGFWHRKRASSETPRIRSVLNFTTKVEGFYGYKVGMTHASFKDTYANSMSKNQMVIKPITVIECPPLKVAGIRFYKQKDSLLLPSSDIFADKQDKELSRSMNVPKHKDFSNIQFDDLRLIVHTNPKITSLPKKKPEIFELSLGGNKDEKFAFAKEKLGKEIDVTEALKLNELVDIHAVTKGKGFQGPVKRFGVQIRSHKSEKSIRNPASLGAWNAQHHIMYRVAHAGQTGYHTRTELNKPVILIANDPSKINPLNGFGRYGNVKTSYIAVLGSIPGPKKRMIRLVHAIRPDAKMKLKAEKLQLLKISQIVQ